MSHYSTALGSLAADGAPPQQQLRAALLTNRALAQHRMGRYAAAAQDAEAALEASASDGKATLRAAAARLMLGDGAAAARHAALFAEQGAGAGGDSAAAPTQQLAAAALARHAAALAAHQQRLAELAQSPAADDCAVADLLAALEAEAEGSGDGAAGPADLAQQLAKRLAADAAAAARLEALQGHQLLIFFLADPDPACQQAAAAALRAAGQAAAAGSPGVVLWPAAVWRRLAALATEAGGAGSALAMQLLGWAAEQDAWVRQHSLLHPLAGAAAPPSAGMTVSPVAQIAGMLGDSARLQRMQPAAVTAAACLLRLYASDAAAAEGLLAQGCQPLLALLRAAAAVESMVVFQPAPDASGSEGSSASSSTADAEEEARQQLRLKLQRVFVGEAVALRHALLGAAADLAAASRALLLAEAVREVDSGKKQAAAGPLLAELLGLARELHEQQPRRTAPELGPDGQPKAYAKRRWGRASGCTAALRFTALCRWHDCAGAQHLLPTRARGSLSPVRRFAADFKDNPAGDFLLTLDGLQPGSASTGGSSTSPQACTGSTSSAAAGQQPTTLLERALSLLQHVACASGSAAALLHRRGLFSLCEELGAYCTPSVVAAAQRLYAAVADR